MRNLPPNQQLIATARWPVVGERSARADEAPWQIRVYGEVETEQSFDLATLQSGDTFELVDQEVDIHCVTRWSKHAVRFRAIMLRDVLKACLPNDQARYLSMVARSERSHSTSIPIELAHDALIAFEAEGKPLPEEHGGPVRVVVPGRYFYKSLKWLETIEVRASDRLGFWESDAGYHNGADPWKEQRYLAPSISKQQATELIRSKDFSHQDLRSIDCTRRTIESLNAEKSLLRDARFASAVLTGASFRNSNLSNAIFDDADLRDADFSGADVEGASFVGADLRGTNLMVTSMFGASFCRRLQNGSIISARSDSQTVLDPRKLDSLTDEQQELCRRIVFIS